MPEGVSAVHSVRPPCLPPEELRHKFRFLMEVLETMGLPLMTEEMQTKMEQSLIELSQKQ